MNNLPRIPSRAQDALRLGLVTTAALALPDVRSELALRLDNGAGAVAYQNTSNLCLRVGDHATPHPLLPPGPFTATWSGTIAADLRGDFRFQVEPPNALPAFALEINGAPVRLLPGALSEPVRLRKGTNSLQATLRRTNHEPIQLRLDWQGRGLPLGPIPNTVLQAPQDPTTSPDADASRLRGRALFLKFRCGKCHAPEVPTPVPELGMDAPRFDDLGHFRTQAWIQSQVLEPRTATPHGSMPQLLRGPEAQAEASAIAAWLSTQRASAIPLFEPGQPGIGRALGERLRCGACHTLPGEAADPTRISLHRLGERFVGASGNLPLFLRNPSARHRWTGMPQFQLSAEEARHLAAWLLADPTASPQSTEARLAPPDPSPLQAAPELIARGKNLVETKGCLRCHEGPATDRSQARALSQLPPDRWTRGCLDSSPAPDASPTAPRYSFNPGELADLRAFGATDRASLGRHVPAEFAERWLKEGRCQSCHAAGTPGTPSLHWVGEKLRPEWTHRLLKGEITEKPRPWLPARMPAFPALASLLPEGLAARHGLPPSSPAEPAADPEAAVMGRKLASANGGLACVTCHAVGPMGASAVFEAPGINFSHVAERLLPDYFTRWVRNPQSIEPDTKMPLYFDEDGNSALADVYGGDGPKTLRALWEYLRAGRAIEPPAP